MRSQRHLSVMQVARCARAPAPARRQRTEEYHDILELTCGDHAVVVLIEQLERVPKLLELLGRNLIQQWGVGRDELSMVVGGHLHRRAGVIALVADGKQSCAGTTETVHRPNRPDVRQRRADPLPPCDGAPRAEGPQRFCPQRVAVRRRPGLPASRGPSATVRISSIPIRGIPRYHN